MIKKSPEEITNIIDTKNKKPSDYKASSYKKNIHKKYNIYSNNDNSNI